MRDADRRVHQSFIMTDDAARRFSKSSIANHRGAIRAKNRFWRAAMRRKAGERENFFIAKNRDSESAQRAFGRHA
jgi:hypothetical protein